MRHERLTPPFSGKRHIYLLIVCVAAVTLCFTSTALAQSGRQKSKTVPTPPPPVSAPPAPAPSPPVTVEQKIEPAIDPPTNKPAGQVSSIIIGGFLVHDYEYLRSRFIKDAMETCTNRLKEQRPSLEITRVGSMTRREALDRAEKETNAYVLWLHIRLQDNGREGISIPFIDYFVLMPKTAKILTTGRVVPRQTSIGGPGGIWVGLPSINRRIPSEYQLKEGVRAIADRLEDEGWFK